MPMPPSAVRRPPIRLVPLLLLAVMAVSACSSAPPTPGSAQPSPSTLPPTPVPTLSPSPTPLPTPRFTNEPDPQLSALIPARIAGAVVVKPPPSAFGTTPGDMGESFGELGLRFQSLVIAYVEKPRMSLYAVRINPPAVQTSELRTFLAAAGEYVGVHGMHPEAWHAAVVTGKQVWTRGEDSATLAGTTLYCWSSGEYVFLLIGSSDAANRAMVKALPGQAAPSPTPSATPSAPSSASPSPQLSQSPSAAPTSSGG